MPILSAVNPSWSDPSAKTTVRRVFVTVSNVSSSILSYLHMAQTGVSSDAPGYDHIQFMTWAHCSAVAGGSVCDRIVFMVFFCISNVTETLFADSRAGEGDGKSRPYLKNRMLHRQSNRVCLCSF